MLKYLIELYDCNLEERFIIKRDEITINQCIYYFKYILNKLREKCKYDLQIQISDDNLYADIFIIRNKKFILLYKLSLVKLQCNYFKDDINNNYNFNDMIDGDLKNDFLKELQDKLSLRKYCVS